MKLGTRTPLKIKAMSKELFATKKPKEKAAEMILEYGKERAISSAQRLKEIAKSYRRQFLINHSGLPKNYWNKVLAIIKTHE